MQSETDSDLHLYSVFFSRLTSQKNLPRTACSLVQRLARSESVIRCSTIRCKLRFRVPSGSTWRGVGFRYVWTSGEAGHFPRLGEIQETCLGNFFHWRGYVLTDSTVPIKTNYKKKKKIKKERRSYEIITLLITCFSQISASTMMLTLPVSCKHL